MTRTLLTLKDEEIDASSNIGNQILKISNTLTSLSLIGNYNSNINALQNNLTSISLVGSRLEKLGDYCFYGCKNLQSINIPSTVSAFGDYCFYGCKNGLIETIPHFSRYRNPTSGDYLILNEDSQTTSSQEDPLEVYAIGERAFAGTDIETLNLNLVGKNYTTDDDYNGCTKTSPEYGPYVGQYAFANCTNLKEVNLLKSTELGAYMFENCTSLTSVNFANHGACVGQAAFKGCTSLESITLPSNFELISKCMFQDCTSLTSVTIDYDESDAKFSFIEEYAFDNTPMQSFVVPESINNPLMIDSNAFGGSNLLSVYLPGISDSDFENYIQIRKITNSDLTSTSTSSESTDTNTTVSTTVTNTTKNGEEYSTGKIIETTDILSVFEAAKESKTPIVIWYTSTNGCSICNKFRTFITDSDEFNAWVKSSGYYFAKINDSDASSSEQQTIWNFFKTRTYVDWQDSDDSLKYNLYVWMALIYYKEDGSLVTFRSGYCHTDSSIAEVQDWKNNTKLSASKNTFNKYKLIETTNSLFSGFGSSDITTTVAATTDNSSESIYVNFNGFGVDHECNFITNSGKIWTYVPVSRSTNKYSLSTTSSDTTTLSTLGATVVINSSGSTTVGNICKITFNDQNNQTIKTLNLENASNITYYAPNMFTLSSGTNIDPNIVFKSSSTSAVDCYPSTFSTWDPELPSNVSQNAEYSAQMTEMFKDVFLDNLGNILKIVDIPTDKTENASAILSATSAPILDGDSYMCPDVDSDGIPVFSHINLTDSSISAKALEAFTNANFHCRVTLDSSDAEETTFLGWARVHIESNSIYYDTTTKSYKIKDGFNYVVDPYVDPSDIKFKIRNRNTISEHTSRIWVPIFSNYVIESDEKTPKFYSDPTNNSFGFYDSTNTDQLIAFYHLPLYYGENVEFQTQKTYSQLLIPSEIYNIDITYTKTETYSGDFIIPTNLNETIQRGVWHPAAINVIKEAKNEKCGTLIYLTADDCNLCKRYENDSNNGWKSQDYQNWIINQNMYCVAVHMTVSEKQNKDILAGNYTSSSLSQREKNIAYIIYMLKKNSSIKNSNSINLPAIYTCIYNNSTNDYTVDYVYKGSSYKFDWEIQAKSIKYNLGL